MGVAARFKQLEECSGMLSVHCICHRWALACGDTGDDLKFISDFETTMIQLWTFFENSPKRLKMYIKTAMRLKEFEDLPRAQQRSLVSILLLPLFIRRYQGTNQSVVGNKCSRVKGHGKRYANDVIKK